MSKALQESIHQSQIDHFELLAAANLNMIVCILTYIFLFHNRFVMGEFANGKFMKILSSILSVVVIVINIFFVSVTLTEYFTAADTHWLYIVGVVVVALCYMLFVGYLSIYMLITLGLESLVEYKWVQKCYNVQEYLDEKKPPA